MNSITLLCLHGVGHAEVDRDFKASWTKAITDAIRSSNPGIALTIDFLEYDELFDGAGFKPADLGLAIGSLLASTVAHSIGDLFSGRRGLTDVPEVIRWTAGMVAQWASDAGLRTKLRSKLAAAMQAKSYDVVLAHSLGSLIGYDTFAHDRSLIDGKVFVSFGSQIGNPAVRNIFAGRIQTLSGRQWYHLFNPHDHVLTYPLDLSDLNFKQVTTQFDIPNDFLNHDATWYLGHSNTIATVWRELAGGGLQRSLTTAARGFTKAAEKPNKRALLIGINNYPNEADRLDGCINDVFLMSSVLQESGFDPEDIRIVLDERATAQGIMDRLHWLLDDVGSGDRRVLFYSGHGAQIPGYGAKDEPDHVDECLVPYDFDWSPERAIRDKQFCELYSQLPYDSYFVAILDCCHSGGMTRDGGPRVRGLTPPDDIRHRSLRWLPKEQMWVSRDFPVLNRSLAKGKSGDDYLGQNGATRRLGRAAVLRTLPNAEYNATRTALGHRGPFLPVLLEACQEKESSYEYRHGATSYGAYTYSMAQVLRENRARGVNPSFEKLNALVTEKLHRLKFDQSPALVGPKKIIEVGVPWSQAARPARRVKSRR